MCGIVGIIGPQLPEHIITMNHSQFHRGPDDGGIYGDKESDVSLAMRRLSIIDLSEGYQPMVDNTKNRVVVFNGEIYNAPELRLELQQDGYVFNTSSSDTEVLLHLYDKYGVEMTTLLNGMFSFVIYDKNSLELFGARDRMGIKPFFYYLSDSNFIFSSEIKSITSLDYFEKEIDLKSLHHFLSLQFIPAPGTIYKKIFKLPSASQFKYSIKSNELVVTKYWDAKKGEAHNIYPDSYEGVKKDIRNLLEESVDMWSRSDVGVGCSLSGGFDSTIVANLYSQKNQDLKTWSLGFSDNYAAEMDERKIASKIADKIGSAHSEIVIDSNNILDDLDAMVWHLDEPYAGGLPSWYVYKAMGQEVKVALTGSGGDEIFGNYGKWNAHNVGIPRVKRSLARIRTMGINNFIKYQHGSLYHQYFGEKEKNRILKVNNQSNTAYLLNNYWQGSCIKEAEKIIPYIDLQMQLPEEFMMMTDRFSMAWSVEARTPLLDHRLVEYCLALPKEYFNYHQHHKQLLLDSAKDLIPDFVMKQTKKGFVLPVAEWIRGKLRPMVEELLGEKFLEQQGLFNENIYKLYVEPHLLNKKDFSDRIWTLLMFQVWYKNNF